MLRYHKNIRWMRFNIPSRFLQFVQDLFCNVLFRDVVVKNDSLTIGQNWQIISCITVFQLSDNKQRVTFTIPVRINPLTKEEQLNEINYSLAILRQTESIIFSGCKLAFTVDSTCLSANFQIYLRCYTLLYGIDFRRSKNDSSFNWPSKTSSCRRTRFNLFVLFSKYSTHISSLKVYPVCFKCRDAVDLSIFSLSAITSVEIPELFCIKLRTTSSFMPKDRPERG